MTREEIIGEINALKILLKDSDYIALKVTEAMMNGISTHTPHAGRYDERRGHIAVYRENCKQEDVERED